VSDSNHEQDYVKWLPIVDRPQLRWPGGENVALLVVVTLEHYDWEHHEGSFSPTDIPGRRGNPPRPDYQVTTWREYGNRIGAFRVMEVLDELGIQASVAMDAVTAMHYPYLVKECLQRNWEFVGHGMAVTRMISSRMSDNEERAYIKESLSVLREKTGQPVNGWLGPEYGESHRTPRLLMDQDIQYVFDWVNDEQPFELCDGTESLVALPVYLDLDDLQALWHKRLPVGKYLEMIKQGFDVLDRDGVSNARLLVLNLHPWYIGQPHRIAYLKEALSYIVASGAVWKPSASRLVSHYKKQIDNG